MIERLKTLFKGSKQKGISGYAGLSDFLVHAPEERKKAVFSEAARRANKDQMETFVKSQIKAEA